MEGAEAEDTGCMTGVGIGPARLELDTVGAGTRTGTAGCVTGNAVVRTTGLGTVTGITVRGTCVVFQPVLRRQYRAVVPSSGQYYGGSTDATCWRNTSNFKLF